MASPIPQVNPQQLQTIMSLVGQRGTDITTILKSMFPTLSPDELASLTQRTVAAIEQAAAAGPRPEAIRALEQLAPNYPSVLDSCAGLPMSAARMRKPHSKPCRDWRG